MSVSYTQAVDSLRENQSQELCPVRQILENGERIGRGNWKDVFYCEDETPFQNIFDSDNGVVAKIFSSNDVEGIRKRIERAHSDYFPGSALTVCDTTAIDNPEVSLKEENAAIVIQERSEESVLDKTSYEKTLEESTHFVDQLVGEGQILDDFKAEAIHHYEDGLKYVDFEDKDAVKTWPLHEDVSTNRDVTYEMALMYANLATGISQEYGRDLGAVKDNIAFNSEIINDEVYSQKGFVPEMIEEWHYS